MLTSSTSTAANCPTLLVFLKSSFARLLRAPFARLTSTLTLVWLSQLLFVRLWLRNLLSSTRVNIADLHATSWRKCTSTRSQTCSVQTTSWLSSTNSDIRHIKKYKCIDIYKSENSTVNFHFYCFQPYLSSRFPAFIIVDILRDMLRCRHYFHLYICCYCL